MGCECYRRVNESYIGRIIDTDEIIALSGKNDDGRTLVTVRCTECSKERTVLYKMLNRGNAKKCECQLQVKRNDYDSYIGTSYCGYKIIEIMHENAQYYFNLVCETCGDSRIAIAKSVVSKMKKGANIAKCKKCVANIHTQYAKMMYENTEG